MKIRSDRLLWAAVILTGLAQALADNPFPSQITTRDGRTYNDTEKLRVEPDGILVQYQPGHRGFGMAKLKFQDLPDDLQRQYGYDAKAAAEYEKQQAEAQDAWRSQAAANDWLVRYRALAELNRSFGGDSATAFSVSVDASGKVTGTGMTGTPRSMSVTNVTIPTYIGVPFTHGYQTDYIPMQAPLNPYIPQ